MWGIRVAHFEVDENLNVIEVGRGTKEYYEPVINVLRSYWRMASIVGRYPKVAINYPINVVESEDYYVKTEWYLLTKKNPNDSVSGWLSFDPIALILNKYDNLPKPLERQFEVYKRIAKKKYYSKVKKVINTLKSNGAISYWMHGSHNYKLTHEIDGMYIAVKIGFYQRAYNRYEVEVILQYDDEKYTMYRAKSCSFKILETAPKVFNKFYEIARDFYPFVLVTNLRGRIEHLRKELYG